MSKGLVPRVAFLGIADRALSGLHHDTPTHSLVNLRNVIFPFFYPSPVARWNFVFAIYNVQEFPISKIKFRYAGVDVGFLINIEARIVEDCTPGQPVSSSTILHASGVVLMDKSPEWTVVIYQVDGNYCFLQPGTYDLLLDDSGNEVHVGSLGLGTCELPPLTEDRKAALRSDPSIARSARLDFKCNECKSCFKSYTGFERNLEMEHDGYVWFENLPTIFRCACGKQEVNLELMRKNMHGLLQSTSPESIPVSIIPLYESNALQFISQNFALLLERNLHEEAYQEFFEKNLILFHSFSPVRLFVKAPVLSLRKTDFAIVTPRRELLLIEIEKPETKILKADGGIHSQLQHAFDQAREWLHVFNEHRLAALECIGLSKEEVGSVKACVIAGRDFGYNSEHLRRLKGQDHGAISFLTYDDFINGFNALKNEVQGL